MLHEQKLGSTTLGGRRLTHGDERGPAMSGRGRVLRRSALLTVVAVVAGVSFLVPGRARGVASPIRGVLTGASTAGDLNKIKHVVMIMQENRSFDEYFGQYPGARRSGTRRVHSQSRRRRLLADLSRRQPRQLRRPALDQFGDARDRQRQDGWFRERVGNPLSREAHRGVQEPQHAVTRSARLQVAFRHPELLDLRWTSSSCTITCSRRRSRGAFPSTSTWCRHGRQRAR